MNETGTTSDNNDALENGQEKEQCAQESEQEGKTECLGLKGNWPVEVFGVDKVTRVEL